MGCRRYITPISIGRGKADEYFDFPQLAFVFGAISKTSNVANPAKLMPRLVLPQGPNGLLALISKRRVGAMEMRTLGSMRLAISVFVALCCAPDAVAHVVAFKDNCDVVQAQLPKFMEALVGHWHFRGEINFGVTQKRTNDALKAESKVPEGCSANALLRADMHVGRDHDPLFGGLIGSYSYHRSKATIRNPAQNDDHEVICRPVDGPVNQLDYDDGMLSIMPQMFQEKDGFCSLEIQIRRGRPFQKRLTYDLQFEDIDTLNEYGKDGRFNRQYIRIK